MDSFTMPVGPLTTPPRRPYRKRYRRNSFEEETRLLAQRLFEKPDPVGEEPVNRQLEETQDLEADVETLEDGTFVPDPACEVQVTAEERLLDEAFLMTPENLLTSTPEGSVCFCREQRPDEAEELRSHLSIEATQALTSRERKVFMKSLVRISFYGIMKCCLRQRLFDLCRGCTFDLGGQEPHECIAWLDEDINKIIQDHCQEICLDSIFNAVIIIGFARNSLRITEKHLIQVRQLLNTVYSAEDPKAALHDLITEEDETFIPHIEHLIGARDYKTLLKRRD
ncbi:uncharacterized protein LOC132252216 [Alligator mississippiensis]|uniref:uncharacterized protein LOC132252215 n=1 Tax=Alligator mississippiensis TaxID=8496 RepID=UPI002877717B|nr:uncharacterized protein LOC132252215 [Alligator mississippiensis]XP_059589099.1 uncharacterized protein LOC132252216 [Alligator mississippiensis]